LGCQLWYHSSLGMPFYHHGKEVPQSSSLTKVYRDPQLEFVQALSLAGDQLQLSLPGSSPLLDYLEYVLAYSMA
jgi:hypothetical protein